VAASLSIITPSFRSLSWLPLCVASVADQRGVEVEHLVQDGGSDDGTVQWLKSRPEVKAVTEPDAGMYDAINRGLRRARGDILAHLNADEQYLPGALKEVAEFFAAHPETDILFAHTVITDAEGGFICCKKAALPRRVLLWGHNPTSTSALFFHRRVLETHALYFEPEWRIIGDAAWLHQAVDRRLKMAVLQRFTSTFTETGENLYFAPKCEEETARLRARRPRWIGRMLPLVRMLQRLDRLSQGVYRQGPFEYAIYTRAQPARRTTFPVSRPTTVWWNRSRRGSSPFTQKMRRRFFSGASARGNAG
jgi:glycosyltransferase involved in cell wall biosynthesis